VVWVIVPRALQYVDDKVTGGVTSTAAARLGHYLMYEKHNIVLVCELMDNIQSKQVAINT